MSSRSNVYHPVQPIDLTQENSSWALMSSYVERENALLLDVGCACGDFGIALKKRHPGITIIGLELDEHSARVAMSTGAYAEVCRVNLDTVENVDIYGLAGRFDYIICGDVLEHLREPGKLLVELKNLLKSDGALIASIPNVAHMSVKAQLLANRFNYTCTGLLDQSHIHFFTGYSIASTLTDTGFAIRDCKFTLFPQNAWHSYNPWTELSVQGQRAILVDWESYVGQFVIAADHSRTADRADLLGRNLMLTQINEQNAPTYISMYRAGLLQALGPCVEDQLRAEIVKRDADICQLRQAYERIIGSRFWRYTSPLRKLLHIIHKITTW